MHLYLFRHADAGNRDEWDGNDADRPLTELGRQQARTLGEAFRCRAIAVDALVTSPLVRTVQTASEFRGGAGLDGQELRHCDLLKPEARKKRKLAKSLNELGVENVAVFGHDPDLPTLLGWLLGCDPRQVYLEKGAVARVSFDGAIVKGTGQLEWVVTPDWYTTRMAVVAAAE